MTENAEPAQFVTPPPVPVDAHGSWSTAKTALGTRLPEDYKHLVGTYGWGEFCDCLDLHTPFGTIRHNGLAWQSGRSSGEAERDRERYPYPLRPAPGGLLIRGTTIDADRLTTGTAGNRPVVVWSGEGRYETRPLGAAPVVQRVPAP